MLPDSVCCSRLVKMARMSKFVLSAQIGAWQADGLTCAFKNVSGWRFGGNSPSCSVQSVMSNRFGTRTAFSALPVDSGEESDEEISEQVDSEAAQRCVVRMTRDCRGA